jgi:hypothetical protein
MLDRFRRHLGWLLVVSLIGAALGAGILAIAAARRV